MCCLFFFFKQKTAYEMRISDWSSDVCSSDLLEAAELAERDHREAAWLLIGHAFGERGAQRRVARRIGKARKQSRRRRHIMFARQIAEREQQRHPPAPLAQRTHDIVASRRSEAHTSELQSLMRNSYAVFCL